MYLCRQNLDRTEEYFMSRQMKRVLHDRWKQAPGWKEPPVFIILIDHVIIDELQPLFRKTDRLETGLIYQVLDWDEVGLITRCS